MAILDPTTPIGKMRLRVGDYSDLPIFGDEVYTHALEDCQGNLPRACTLVAQYILASLTGQTHQKMAQIEVYGNQWFDNYLAFVKATILNPNVWSLAPMPYTPVTLDECGRQVEVPLVQFQKDWNANYAYGTQSQEMRLTSFIPVSYF
jgi:hypothetical protein